MFSDVGDISPFSYFSQPLNYVGNKVQYEVPPEPKTIESSDEPEVVSVPKVPPQEVYATSTEPLYLSQEDIPNDFGSSDELYYSNDDSVEEYYTDDSDDDEYVAEDYDAGHETSSNIISKEPVSYYYKDLPNSYTNHGESVSDSYMSYPSYPPLAPAPPAPPSPSPSHRPPRHQVYGSRIVPQQAEITQPSTEGIFSSTTSQKSIFDNEVPQVPPQAPPNQVPQQQDSSYFSEVPSPTKTETQKRKINNNNGPILSYKSAYTSQSQQNFPEHKKPYSIFDSPPPSPIPQETSVGYQNHNPPPTNPQQPPIEINEPQTIRAPDGSVFYLEEVEEIGPSNQPSYTNEVYKRNLGKNLGNDNSNNQGISLDTKNPATPSSIYYKYPESTPDYTRQETPAQYNPPEKSTTTENTPELSEPAVYYREISQEQTASPATPPLQTVRLSLPQKYPPRLPVKQEVQNGVELTKSSGEPSIAAYDEEYDENYDEEYDEEYDENYDEVAMQSDNLVSFEFPQHQKFEIPEEFRTFLNTPPKWINIENW